jgi:hypothetical protein
MSNSNKKGPNYQVYFFVLAIIVGTIWRKGHLKNLHKDKNNGVDNYSNKSSNNYRNGSIDSISNIDSAFLKEYSKAHKKNNIKLFGKNSFNIDTAVVNKLKE